MKRQEANLGSKTEFAEYVKKVIPDLFAGRLTVEDQQVTIPSDKDLEFKVKHVDDETGGSFTLKVSWENETRDDDEDGEVEVDVD